MRNQRSGFSLVELLIVMIIIAILVAFIGSNIVGHRAVVDEAELQSVLLQVGQAQERYASRNNAYYGGDANTADFPTWTGVDLDKIQGTDPGQLSITVTFVSASTDTYCVEVNHVSDVDNKFSLVPGEAVIGRSCAER